MRLIGLLLVAGLIVVSCPDVTNQEPKIARPAPTVRIWTIAYRAHNGETRRAHVLLPA